MKSEIIKKENSGQISEVINILENKSFENSWYASRLIFNLWYVVLEPDFESIITDKKIYEKKLVENTKKLYKKFTKDEFFLFILAYCINISFWYFLEVFPETNIEVLPAQMVENFKTKKAIELRNAVFRNDKNSIFKICKNFDKYFCINFGFGIMENYFYEIICKRKV